MTSHSVTLEPGYSAQIREAAPTMMWRGREVLAPPNQGINVDFGFFFFQAGSKRRPVDSMGNPFPKPQIKSNWNDSLACEEVIDGIPVKYYVHRFGLRAKKVQIEVVEGPDHLLGFKTEVKKGATKSVAAAKCHDELVNRVHQLATAERLSEKYRNEFRQDPVEENPSKEEKEEPFPDIDITKPKILRRGHPKQILLWGPGIAALKKGTSLLKRGDSWSSLAKDFESKSEKLRTLADSKELAQDFFKKNPHLKELIQASPEEQRDWFLNQAKRLDIGSADTAKTARVHNFAGKIFRGLGNSYIEQVDQSGVVIGTQVGMSLGNHLCDFYFQKGAFKNWSQTPWEEVKWGEIATDIGKTSMIGAAKVFGENIAIDGMKVVVQEYLGETAKEYVPMIRWAGLANKTIVSLSQANSATDVLKTSGFIAVKVGTIILGQSAGNLIPFAGPVLGVIVTRTLDYLIFGAESEKTVELPTPNQATSPEPMQLIGYTEAYQTLSGKKFRLGPAYGNCFIEFGTFTPGEKPSRPIISDH